MEGPLCPPDLKSFRVIETFGWDGRGLARVQRHLARMARTCARLGIAFEPMQVLVALDALPDLAPDLGPLRVRATVAADGSVEVTQAAMAPTGAVWRVGIAGERLLSGDPWLRVKTTERGLYDRVRASLPAGIDEMLFLNERGEVCEGTITTVFFDEGQGLCTPPLACGLLPGILRAELLESGKCREAVLPGAALPEVRLWVGNALRGLIAVELDRKAA